MDALKKIAVVVEKKMRRRDWGTVCCDLNCLANGRGLISKAVTMQGSATRTGAPVIGLIRGFQPLNTLYLGGDGQGTVHTVERNVTMDENAEFTGWKEVFCQVFSYDAKGTDASLISWDCVVVQAFPSAVAPPITMVATKEKASMHGFGWDMPAGLGNMLGCKKIKWTKRIEGGGGSGD